MQSGNLAIVLGGGRGSRLFPLTNQRSKPAVPIAGKYRLIDIPISNCINSGINRIFILTQFLTASLHRHVYDTYKFDIFSKGFVEILPAEQTHTSTDWYQGTADAVRRQQNRIDRINPSTILILPGDHLYKMNYQPFFKFHERTDADITISVSQVPGSSVSRFGIVQCNEDFQVNGYREKPRLSSDIPEFRRKDDPRDCYLASMGIYLFKADILKNLLIKNKGQDFGSDILPHIINDYRIQAYVFEDYWEDIGTIGSFYEANLALTEKKPPFDFFDPNHPIYTRSRFLPHSFLNGTHLKQSLISDGCRITNAEIERCIIGLRSIIRPGARLNQLIMMGADQYEDETEFQKERPGCIPRLGIGEDTFIERAIIDKNVRIGNGVMIRSHEGEPDRESQYYVLRDGIVVIPKNTVIPDYTEL